MTKSHNKFLHNNEKLGCHIHIAINEFILSKISSLHSKYFENNESLHGYIMFQTGKSPSFCGYWLPTTWRIISFHI